MADNPAHAYRELAKKIVSKTKANLIDALELGRTPDLYWKLEQAIVDAMRYADHCGSERTRQQMEDILIDFEDEDGTSQN